ncbi:MAG: T9SS type A sorting domain-containing protein [Chitinophagales bacterium]
MKNLKQLKYYSAFASVFLSISTEANAQVVYTDLEPDFVLNEPGWAAWLDIDNNGGTDFGFANSKYFSWSSFENRHYAKQRLWVFNSFSYPFNEVAGSYQSFVSGGTRYYPFTLAEGELIDNNLEFQYWIAQRLAFKTVVTFEYGGFSFVNTNVGGNWYPTADDKFLGIYFRGELENMHYGWIRCSVKHEGRILVIKDYAYEQQPDVPIIAGSTESYVPVNENENNSSVSVYSFNNTIYINTTPPFGAEISISVFDITGKEITTTTSCLQQTELNINAPAGIYLVEVISDKNKFTKKVFLN